MTKYVHYSTENFLMDKDFIEWVLSPNDKVIKHWKGVFEAHPEVLDNAKHAKDILLNIKIKPGNIYYTAAEKETIIQKVLDADSNPKRSFRLHFNSMTWWLIAASILLISALTFFLKDRPQYDATRMVITEGVGPDHLKKIENRSNAAVFVSLPDQSSIILYPNSHIQYGENNFRNKRDIQLYGQAFFDITPDKSHPFKVKTTNLMTTVLGTSFMVDARPDLSVHKVIVETGAVKVTKSKEQATDGLTDQENESASETITPGQEAMVSSNSISIIKTVTSLSKEPVDASLDFDATPLTEVTQILGNKYDVDIRVMGNTLPKTTITASFRDLSLYQKLDLICKAVSASYVVEDGIIIFYDEKKP